MAHPLDNIAWHSLAGPRRHLGRIVGLAGTFDREVSPMSAIAEDSPEAWRDLAALVGAGRPVVLFGAGIVLPAGWEDLAGVPCGQLVADGLTTGGESEGVVPLGAGDVPEMLALVRATEPGPFDARTVDFGGYVGLRDGDGRLIAMAGERLSGGGYTEVSAVCTDPAHQGRGLGTRMVRAVVEAIRARGEEAFLHVADSNVNAYRLYLALGFAERAKVLARIGRAPS